MTPSQPPDTTLGASGARLTALDAPTAALVRLAARVTAGDEAAVRDGFAECTAVKVPAGWVEELILQSYLFAGFPRALNAARAGATPVVRRAFDLDPRLTFTSNHADLYPSRRIRARHCLVGGRLRRREDRVHSIL